MEKSEAINEAAEYANKIIIQELEAIGLTRPYYAQKLKELCEATKPISCIKGKEADGGLVDFVDVPDYRVQLDAVKTIIGLYGDNAPVKTESEEVHTFGLSPELQEMFDAIYANGKKKRGKK